MVMIGNIKKFSFAEMTSNNNGKTSVTSTSGAYIIFIGGLGFIAGCIDKMFLGNTVDIINQSIMLVTIGAGLLGVKNITGSRNQMAEAKAVQIKSEIEQN